MSEASDWFERMWCQRQGHKHDVETQLGCLLRVLGALRGEEPVLRERVLAAAIAHERLSRTEGQIPRQIDATEASL